MDKYTQSIIMFSEEFEDEKRYWMEKLKGNVTMSAFPADFTLKGKEEYKREYFTNSFEDDIYEKLMKLSKGSKYSLYMILLSAVKFLLFLYTGNNDITVGMPQFRQNNEQSKACNFLFLRTELQDNYTYRDFLIEVRRTVTEADKNPNIPYEGIAQIVGIKTEEYPVFKTLVLMEDIHDVSGVERIKADMVIAFKGNLEICIEYNAGLYRKDTVERISYHLMSFLNSVIENTDIRINDIEVLSEAELHRLLYEYNDTATSYPNMSTINSLFEGQVQKNCNRPALTFEDTTLTYDELNKRANALARELCKKGSGREKIVAMLMERSVEMVVGILAILKSGGAYLPINPNYPTDRIQYTLQDSGAEILLTDSKSMSPALFNEMCGLKVINIEDESIYNNDGTNLENTNSPSDLAYIIYTSGTTGKPKGVMIEHRNVVRLMFNDRMQFDFRATDVWTMFHSYCFDFSVWEMYGALLYGGRLVVIPELVAKDTREYLKVLKKEKVTVLNQTPTAFYNLSNEELKTNDRELLIRYVIFGGEALKPALLKGWKDKYPDTSLVNMYGITETTVHVTYKEITKFEIDNNISNIGRPIPTLTMYIMDRNLKLLPPGAPGELCVGGEGVGRGYLNRPELTAAKFVLNPYKPEERLYRSGDLARLLPGGEAEYLGRIDHQVKIRGHRIELGEIESCLLKNDEIKETVVVAIEDNDGVNSLCAYFVSEKEITIARLREQLSRDLPDYMLPSYFMRLDKMPVTSNGKVDRKALPRPVNEVVAGNEYVPPSNETEEKLTALWEEVLGVSKIGVENNFFDLGGHSLKATSLVSKIHKEFNVQVTLGELFSMPTIKELAQHMASSSESIYSQIEPAREAEYYPLSSAQKRLFVIEQLGGMGITYNIPQVVTIEGKLDVKKLEESFKMLILRHEALRTSFELVDGEPVQKIAQDVDFSIYYTRADEKDIEETVLSFIRPFKLDKAPLLRVGLIEIDEKRHLLIADMHHIISDGVSGGILLREFSDIYHNKETAPVRIQYKDFAVWQNNVFRSDKFEKQEQHWMDVFKEEIPVLNMPLDYKRPFVQSFKGESINIRVDKNILEGIKELASKTGSTMFMVMLAAYNILLYKYTGQEDIIVGCPIAGRPHADLQNIIGMFVNTLAMRSKPNGNKSFVDFLGEIREYSLKAYENQDYPLEMLVEKLQIKRDPGRNPLFDTMFALQNMDTQNIELNELKLVPYAYKNSISKFDITLSAFEAEDYMGLSFEYCTELFKRSTIERLGKHFLNILEAIANNPDLVIKDLVVLSFDEKSQILSQFNETYSEFPKEKTLQSLFEEQAATVPDNIAIEYGSQILSYRELNSRANRMAQLLQNLGVRQGDLVAMLVPRSIDMITGILGILKAGCAYLPIDPEYPTDRIKTILEDSGVSLLLTHSSCIYKEDKAQLSYESSLFNVKAILMDKIDDELMTLNDQNPQFPGRSTDLAYVMYTSGSTGKPKGILTMHYNVSRVVKNTNYIDISDRDVLLQLSNYSFDGSTFDIFGALLNGARLVLVDRETLLNLDRLSEVIRNKGITIFFVTTALFNTLVDYDVTCLKNIKKILFGGERVSVRHAAKAASYLGRGRIIHVYGPTESTVFATYYFADSVDDKCHTVPIGKPLSNTKIYIVDRDGCLCPVGVPGELCISGDGIAKEYLNRPELTANKFVPNPFVEKEDTGNQIMYRTGDLAKWLPDGNIEFIDRIDTQVKLRGFRIELGEIEARLLELEGVKEAFVAVIEDMGGKYLCAYIVGDGKTDETALKKELSSKLPDYMIPSCFVYLDKMPLTQNGKVDRKALPEPGIGTWANIYEAPSGEIEERLTIIWQDILGVQNIGVKDDFFAVGGHSLKAALLASRIHKEFGVEMTLKEVFTLKSIKEQSGYIETAEKNIFSSIKPALVNEFDEFSSIYPMSSAQMRMYALNQTAKEQINYNIPGAMIIEGKLDIKRLEEAFKTLVKRHESLRTAFVVVDGLPVQKVYKNVDFSVVYDETEADTDEQKIVEDFIKPFDLSRAPLFRVALVKIRQKAPVDRYILMFDMHHIVSDGTSMGIMIKEFSELYKGCYLPELSLQYRDYALWQQNKEVGEVLKRQEEYWLERFKGDIPQLNLPLDYDRKSSQGAEGDIVRLELHETVVQGLSSLAFDTGATLYMVLLSAYGILLSKYSGQEDIVIGSPIAGRPHADLQDIIGMFVNMLPIRCLPQKDIRFIDYLEEVRFDTLKAFENQSLQFEELVAKLGIKRNPGRNPIFDVMFAMQNLDIPRIKYDDLEFIPFQFKNRIIKFDLELYANPDDGKLELCFQYNTGLFKQETIERMLKDYTTVLDLIIENREIPIKDIALAHRYMDLESIDLGDVEFNF